MTRFLLTCPKVIKVKGIKMETNTNVSNIQNNNSSVIKTQNTANNQLYFDPDVIKERDENQASSLEDMYGYAVFSDDFTKQIELEKKRIQKENNNAFKDVMKNKSTNEIDKTFANVMNGPTSQIITKDYNNSVQSKENLWLEIFYVALGMIITLVVIHLAMKVKKKMRLAQ